jgi:cell wall-associated NlpC family hydrolase
MLVIPAPPAAAHTVRDLAAVPEVLAARAPLPRAARWFERSAVPVQPVTEIAAVAVKPKKPAVVKPVVRKPAVKTAPKVKPPVEKVTVTASGSIGVVLTYARAQLGKPYVWAAAGPGGFDCSGLVMASFARIGVKLPHQTGSLIGRGRAVTRAQLRPGDLVFPSSGHVGIYIGNGMMIHAPHPGDHVKVAAVYAFYAGRRIIG